MTLTFCKVLIAEAFASGLNKMIEIVVEDEGVNSFDDSVESNNNMKGSRRQTAPHLHYTRGIDVQNITLQSKFTITSEIIL